jgi:hypothetical protein
MTRLAGVFALLAGLGFGVPGVFGVLHFASTGQVWQFMGFPTYGDGPFVRVGLTTSVLLLLGFVVVCAAEVVVGLSLVAGWATALWIQFALLPFELAYWWGFGLPFGFVFGAARVAVAVLALTRGRVNRTNPT